MIEVEYSPDCSVSLKVLSMSKLVSDVPLLPKVAGVQWQYFWRRRTDSRFTPFAEKVWRRDQYQCHYCGFASKKHMDIINRNGNYHQNTMANMVTSCFLCTPCFFLESVGQMLPGNGVFIYLPDMSQAELNALCHLLMFGMVTGSEQLSQLRTHYRSLRLRSQLVEKHVGEGLSDVAHYVRIVSDMNLDKMSSFQKTFDENIRLLPDMLSFSSLIQECAIDALAVDPFTHGGA